MKQIAAVGNYGAKVAILRRKGTSGPFYLRWRDRETGKLRSQVTDCNVLTKAKQAALAKAQELTESLPDQVSRSPRTTKQAVATWGRLLDWYELTWVPLSKSKSEQNLNPRALALWRSFLPLKDPVEELEPAMLTAFMQKRKAGGFTVGEYVYAKDVTDRTVGRDLEWLRGCVNRGIDSPTLRIRYNPLGTIKIPNTPMPKRPVATVERWEALRAQPDSGSQGLFGGFLDLLRALGWRVRALCEIRLEDINTAAWRIRKQGMVDKEGHDVWVPVSESLKPKLEALLKARHALKVESPYLFPMVHRASDPWRIDYVRARLETAEKTAGLKPLDGGDFHPYRRLWARSLKDQPTVNVAAAGAWKTSKMVELYQGLVTEEEVASVMNTISF